jgi:hypothetical protein
MPQFVPNPKNTKRLEDISNFTSLTMVFDTEFVQTPMQVLSVQVYWPHLDNRCLVYTKNELNNSFEPWLQSLGDLGYQVSKIDSEKFAIAYYQLQDIWEYLSDGIVKANDIRKAFEVALECGRFDSVLDSCGFTRDLLKYKRQHKNSTIELAFPVLKIHATAHFAEADLGKIVGTDNQVIMTNASLESRRTVKTSLASKNPIQFSEPVRINGKWYEVQVEPRDTMHRLPVLSGKGLENQCRVYQASVQKIDIETDEIGSKLGLKSAEIKSNMDVLLDKMPQTFTEYGAVDCFATQALAEKTCELLNGVRSEFGLEPVEIHDIKDTAGSNISRFNLDLITKHFNAYDKDSLATLKNRIRAGNADNIQHLEYNKFGIQPLQTVGGLLFSRMARVPSMHGIMGDLDEKSCYATALGTMHLYLGQPVIRTFRGKRKPKLLPVIQLLEKICPREGWLVRVSGKFQEAVNTLLLSNLAFKESKIVFKTIFDARMSRKFVNDWNAYKTSNQEAQSTILTKECKFSLVNAELLDCIKLLPETWQREYFDLLVDAIVFVPNELVCEDLQELRTKQSKYPTERDSSPLVIDFDNGKFSIELEYSQENLCLRYPIKDYFEQLKAKRNKYKKERNPIQEVLKLVLNSTYGALACEHLPINNLLAANHITASARATSWCMLYALNGCQVITDGCQFLWQNLPLNTTFKTILKRNPNYLIEFDKAVVSNIPESTDQSWIDANFHKHLIRFFEAENIDCRPLHRYDFELKTESFPTACGKSQETPIFHYFVNHGSGSYAKGYEGGILLCDGNDYVLENPTFNKVKARSFKGSDSALMQWYLQCFENGYTLPVIYKEFEILKFGKANELAVRLLQSADEIAHPMGFSTHNFKLMKLITRSQFLFQSAKQLRNFERANQLGKLDKMSDKILTLKFWRTVKIDDLKPYGVSEFRPHIDYRDWAKNHSIGLGFEVLTYLKKHNGSLESVRNLISDKIQQGTVNFNAALNLEKCLEIAFKPESENYRKLQLLFAAITVNRANALDDLRNNLIEACQKNPTILKVSKDNIYTLSQLLNDD